MNEQVITVNPIHENDHIIHITDAVLFVEPKRFNIIYNIGGCLAGITCACIVIFLLFLGTGGIGFFLTINSRDDAT
jgi:hypothetical protein